MFWKRFMKEDDTTGRSLVRYLQQLAGALALAPSTSGVLGGNLGLLVPLLAAFSAFLSVGVAMGSTLRTARYSWNGGGNTTHCQKGFVIYRTPCCCLQKKNIRTCLAQIQLSFYRHFIWAFQSTKSTGSSSAISQCEHCQLNSQCFCLLSY